MQSKPTTLQSKIVSKRIELHISDISPSGTTSGAYQMVLMDLEGIWRLPIIIGGAEAQAIAIAMERIEPLRPLTHDLFKTLATSFAIEVMEVEIYNFKEGVFHSKIVALQDSRQVEIDSRTSDAVAIALRFDCPIFCKEFILKENAITHQDEKSLSLQDVERDLFHDDELESPSVHELEEALQQALDNEEYERASQLRDQINKLKKEE
jgi:bifunctional DNase/RNase